MVHSLYYLIDLLFLDIELLYTSYYYYYYYYYYHYYINHPVILDRQYFYIFFCKYFFIFYQLFCGEAFEDLVILSAIIFLIKSTAASASFELLED